MAQSKAVAPPPITATVPLPRRSWAVGSIKKSVPASVASSPSSPSWIGAHRPVATITASNPSASSAAGS